MDFVHRLSLKSVLKKMETMNKKKIETNPDFRPLYVQVMEIISKRIEKGEWGPGEVLPAEPKFAEELGGAQKFSFLQPNWILTHM